MTEPTLPLSDFSEFRDLASSDRQIEVSIRPLEHGLYAIILRILKQGREVGLSRDGAIPSLQTFEDLEECIRVAITLSRTGHIFFDVLQ